MISILIQILESGVTVVLRRALSTTLTEWIAPGPLHKGEEDDGNVVVSCAVRRSATGKGFLKPSSLSVRVGRTQLAKWHSSAFGIDSLTNCHKFLSFNFTL